MPSAAALRRFGGAVTDARIARDLSQDELADKAGVSQSNVSGWELGRWAPDPDDVFKLERVLRLQPGTLSTHLGYEPVKVATKPPDVIGAVMASSLDSIDKRALAGLYRELVRRRGR